MTLNRLSGLIFAAIGMVLLFWIIPHQTEVVNSGWLKPRTLPRITAVIIIIGGLVHFIFPAGKAEFDLVFARRMGLFFAVTIAGTYLMNLIGFVLAAPLLILLIMMLIKERRPLWLVSGIILLPAFIWFCVGFLLNKPLP